MTQDKEYKICVRCVMDTSDPDISFSSEGICCHCIAYQVREETELHLNAHGQAAFKQHLAQIKAHNKDKPYNCLIGLSGGVDSSYVAYLVKKHGLRPLTMHFDNGWNSELAVSNVEKIVKTLGFDYLTFVINWPEFRDLQKAYLLAGVVNAEVPTDHAISAQLLQTAAAHNIKYIINGGNLATEAIMPKSWVYNNRDWRNIKAIHHAYGTQPLKEFPHFGLAKMAYYILVKQIKFFSILNYVDYNKAQATQTLSDELGWRAYGGKHFESVFTRFYQAYILYHKFNIDKRRAHLSTLINSGQITRADALSELETPPCSWQQANEDKIFVIKKLGFTEAEFDALMQKPPVPHTQYANHDWLFTKSPRMMAFVKNKLAMK